VLLKPSRAEHRRTNLEALPIVARLDRFIFLKEMLKAFA
jgi:hypothetical protein